MAIDIKKDILSVLEDNDIEIKEGRDRQEYLYRVCRATNDLSDKEFDKIAKSSQDWLFKNFDLHKEKKDLIDFPKLEEKTEAPSRRRMETESEGKKDKKEKEPPIIKVNRQSKSYRAKHMMATVVTVKDGHVVTLPSAEDIQDALYGDGVDYKLNSLMVSRGEFINTLAALADMGLLQKDIEPTRVTGDFANMDNSKRPRRPVEPTTEEKEDPEAEESEIASEEEENEPEKEKEESPRGRDRDRDRRASREDGERQERRRSRDEDGDTGNGRGASSRDRRRDDDDDDDDEGRLARQREEHEEEEEELGDRRRRRSRDYE